MLQLVLKTKWASLHWPGLAPWHWQRRTDCVWQWLPDEPTTTTGNSENRDNEFVKLRMTNHKTMTCGDGSWWHTADTSPSDHWLSSAIFSLTAPIYRRKTHTKANCESAEFNMHFNTARRSLWKQVFPDNRLHQYCQPNSQQSRENMYKNTKICLTRQY